MCVVLFNAHIVAGGGAAGSLGNVLQDQVQREHVNMDPNWDSSPFKDLIWQVVSYI